MENLTFNQKRHLKFVSKLTIFFAWAWAIISLVCLLIAAATLFFKENNEHFFVLLGVVGFCFLMAFICAIIAAFYEGKLKTYLFKIKNYRQDFHLYIMLNLLKTNKQKAIELYNNKTLDLNSTSRTFLFALLKADIDEITQSLAENLNIEQ